MKNFNLQNLIRENIKNLIPYSSARDEFKDFDQEMVFLDANENPFENGVNRYPDTQQKSVKKLLSKIKNIPEKHMLLGNGSDEILDLIFRAFCEPGQDNIITLPPTYGMYGVLANLNNIQNQEIILTNKFEPNVEQILNAVNENTKIIFLCSPNNPTGNSFSDENIVSILQNFSGLVVLDEAYIDFSSKPSWLIEMQNYPNLIISQTLSKAYGMAGIRLGILYASVEIVSILNKIKPPYNINTLTQKKAIERLRDYEFIQTEVTNIINQRNLVNKELSNITLVKEIFVTDANFILIKVENATKLYLKLIEKGIVLRNRTTQPLCENCIRITIGTEKENQKLINTLKQL